jgi:small multidrug resistance pump
MKATSSSPLSPWMTRLLWFVGGYNLLAGVGMICFYHEGYKLLGVEKPQLNLPIQLVGILVGLFGVGYWMVAANPLQNRNILWLGFWSKALGSVLGIYYVVVGKLPPFFLAMLFVSDIVYLPPFYLILRRLKQPSLNR